MRVLAVLLVLFSVPALAIPALAQQPQQQQQQPSGPGSGSQTGPQRYPGDYCTSHCRANEIPCGRGCISTKGGGKCTEKVTTTCAGKP